MKPYLLLPCLLLSACVGLPPAIENAPAIQLSYNQVSRDINSYKDAPVRWGGVIIDVENEEQSSLMQILFYPLDYRGRPQLYKAGEGRFVVKSTEFLDPVIYAKDKEITVAGVIIGNIERTVGKKIIQVPLLSATAIYMWPPYRSYYDYRNYGPYPYFGYPGYYPFYRGGFYGPYYRW
ncbi:Slp family lipoprotein [Nitrosomonas sp. Nm166]|uniref:Slp family lipoprotein n=1 Tax=Nitrosomonas sp. Nm166 TaxID=1881054 RepID=UPI0008F1D47D|nr:Slp family lipoprotein [Nitrosomonas sp. Nm166]SFF05071.1 outer membrane lipoprotein [Nitrosomonas sp. Nm166]